MIDTLSIQNFKAFGDKPISFELTPERNLLLCGENGSGKSSIYEAIRWAFRHKTIISKNVSPSIVDEDVRQNIISTLKAPLNNKKTGLDFEIKIDGQDYETCNLDAIQLTMINPNAVKTRNAIDLQTLIEDSDFEINLNDWMSVEGNLRFLVEHVNCSLQNNFLEDFEISISDLHPYRVTFIDNAKHLNVDEYIPQYINEAKIHIVVLLLLLHIACMNKHAMADGTPMKQLLVIDDVFSSLDIANRNIFARIIVNDLSQDDFRQIILTHNVSLFNLIRHVANTGKYAEKWKYYHLYEGFDGHGCYSPSKNDVDDLEKELNSVVDHGDSLDDIGNKFRKKFETQIHQLAELMMVGAQYEVSDLIEGLKKSSLYIHGSNITGTQSMVRRIIDRLAQGNDANLKDDIDRILDDYKEGSDNLKATLDHATLYRKVVLHPLSHVGGALVPYSIKELKTTIGILKKLSKIINRLTSHDEVTNI